MEVLLIDMFSKFAIIFVILIGIGALYWFGLFGEVKNNQDGSGTTVTIRDATFHVDVADTPQARSKGLSGRESLDRDEGLLFNFSGSATRRFWMKDMLIPIDIIWIDAGVIVGFSEDAQPEPGVSTTDLMIYASPEPANQVLEVQAGTVGRERIVIGDAVIVQ